MTTSPLVVFSHGKESGPEGSKIQALRGVAKTHNIPTQSLDYRFTQDPTVRVEYLLEFARTRTEKLILVGSSMGGYVSIQAASILRPHALFLMAPAVYLPGYSKDPELYTRHIQVIHGLHDDIVPVDNAVRFARKHQAELFLLDTEHTLQDQIPFLCQLFARFLKKAV